MASGRTVYRGVGAFLLTLAAPVFSQSITTSPLAAGPAIPVPVGSPLMLALMAVLVLALALWVLRKDRLRRTLLSVLVVGCVVGAAWQSPVLRAQLLASFTDPQGETLPIPVVQIPSAGDIAGFELADFNNAAGAPLTISNVDEPVFEDCFPEGLSGTLLPGTNGGAASPGACTGVLEDGASCRVDVDSICRAAAEANVAVLSLSGSPLTLTANGPAAAMTVTNTSNQVTASNVASSFTGTALAGNVTESGNTCAAVPPGGSCTLTYTPGDTAVLGIDFTISGDNTNTLAAAIEVQAAATLTAITPAEGTALGGTSVTLTGTDLTGATGVTFGGIAATSVAAVDATTVTAVTPARAVGTVDVVITTPSSTATLVNGYTYVAAEASLSVSDSPLTLTANGPASAMTVSNTSTQVTATNIASSFTGTSLEGNVTESGNTCASVPPGGSCTLTYTPGNTVVPATDFTISGDNTNTLTAAIEVQSGSTLTAINPTQGTASGGTGITLTGTGLTGATGITFGGVAATSVNVVNSTTVTAVTPAQASGTVDVAIATPAGSATLADGYTYVATAVGQSSGGGIIAALNGGLQNLIAATADNSTGIQWGGFGTATSAQSDTDGASNTEAAYSGEREHLFRTNVNA